MTHARATRITLSVTEAAAPDPRHIAAGISLLMLALLAYSYLIFSDAGFIWDDDAYVLNNVALRSVGGIGQIWFGILPDPHAYAVPQYYPMTLSSFWLEYRIWGINPLGYH